MSHELKCRYIKFFLKTAQASLSSTEEELEPPCFETYKTGLMFLLMLEEEYSATYKTAFPLPEFSVGPENSIDFFWERNNADLVLNVRKGRVYSYYGIHKASGNEVKEEGSTRVIPDSLLEWIHRYIRS